MELKILDTKNKETGKVALPKQFSEEIRPDLIKRAVLAIQSHDRQPYGADPEAGKKSSAELSRRRRKYRGSYGMGISRVPRKILSRRGTRMSMVGAFAPGTVGGRRAHAPKAEKIWDQKINDNERRKAIRSAMAATVDKEIVSARGHLVPTNYPFVIDNDFESLSKTKDVKTALEAIGFKDELSRGEKKTIRAGKGKARGRPYKKKKSLLLVVSEKCSLPDSAKNLAGVEIVSIDSLNAELLAPGTDIGRATLFTKKAIEALDKKGLFTKKTKLPKAKAEKPKKEVKNVEVKKEAKKAPKAEVKKTTKKTTKKTE
jgi:large subunit ribosomal protein L4e